MNYTYRNNTKRTICYKLDTWLPGDERSTTHPVPSELGLTCIQEGTSPDTVLFHSDIFIPPASSNIIDINAPIRSHNIALSIQCMTPSSGVACRFNHEDNKPIPIDARAFSQTLAWDSCSRIFLENSTDTEAVISVTAIEAGV